MQCSAIRAKLPHSENSLQYFSVDSIAVPVFAVWLNLTNTVSEWIRSLIYFSENYYLQKSAVFVQFIKPEGTAQRKFIALVQACKVEHRTAAAAAQCNQALWKVCTAPEPPVQKSKTSVQVDCCATRHFASSAKGNTAEQLCAKRCLELQSPFFVCMKSFKPWKSFASSSLLFSETL